MCSSGLTTGAFLRGDKILNRTQTRMQTLRAAVQRLREQAARMCDHALTPQSRWGLLLMMLSVVAAGVTRSTASQEASRTAVVAAIEARLEAAARNDRDAWSRHVASDDRAGESLGRDEWQLEAGHPHGSMEDLDVRFYGQTAVVSYRPSRSDVVQSDGRAGSRRVETLVRRDGRWLLVGIARDRPAGGSSGENDLSERASVGRRTVLH